MKGKCAYLNDSSCHGLCDSEGFLETFIGFGEFTFFIKGISLLDQELSLSEL